MGYFHAMTPPQPALGFLNRRPCCATLATMWWFFSLSRQGAAGRQGCRAEDMGCSVAEGRSGKLLCRKSFLHRA